MTITNVEMQNALKEVIDLKFQDTDTLADCMNKFYDIMRKYGIKKCVQTENGLLGDTTEWSSCRLIFLDSIVCHFNMSNIIAEVPKDLES